MSKNTYTQAAAQLKKQRIVELLTGEEMVWTQVAYKLHVHRQTASRYLWHMARQSPREIHVCDWTEDEKSGRKIPVFTAGNKPNKKKPRPLTYAEVFARIQADPVRHAKRREKYRAQWHRNKGREVPPRPVASPFAALPGMPRLRAMVETKEVA